MSRIRFLILMSLLVCCSVLHAQEPTKDILYKLSHIKQPEASFHIKLWLNKNTYRPGDKINFYFSTDRNCYLTIIDVATEGIIRVIFPNKYSSDNLVYADRTYNIPGDYNLSMKVTGPAGIEKIKAIATTKPMDIFNMDFINGDYFFFENKLGDGVVTRGIGGLASKLEKYTWAETALEFEINNPSLPNNTRGLEENIGRPSPKPIPSAGTEEHGLRRGLRETED